LVAAVVVSASCASRVRILGQPPVRTNTITLSVSCADLRVTIAPWIAQPDPTQRVRWVLDAGSDDVPFQVHKKHWYNNWPFKNGPHKGNKGTPAESGDLDQGANGDTSYNVEANCSGTRLVIDPILIIRPG
jgi:hypothetical protein